jgi:hypothetical protein
VAAAVALLLASSSSVAWAQGSKAAKPKATQKTAAPSDTSGAKDESATTPAATSDTDPGAAAATDANADADAAATKPEKKADPSAVEPPHDEWDPSNVEEIPGKSYFFMGLRYRGDVIPTFRLNLFVVEGATVYSNTVGIEFDLRKDGFSLIPALSYQEYGTDDILFKQKNKPDIPGNYSVINSGMKAIYATADLLWSTKISKNVEFEYGAGFGIGAVFGPLKNNWVTQDDANGNLPAANGHKYRECPGVQAAGTGCNKADHQNSDVDKVQGYTEPSWFSGGSKPVLFPWIAVPQIGLRFKPVKQFVGRLGLGFSLTGFWFGLSGEYGLEKKPSP